MNKTEYLEKNKYKLSELVLSYTKSCKESTEELTDKIMKLASKIYSKKGPISFSELKEIIDEEMAEVLCNDEEYQEEDNEEEKYEEIDETILGDEVKEYLKEIGRYPLFTPAEEREIFLKYKSATGEEKKRLKDEIIKRNLRLPFSIAKKYIGHGLEFSDLIQEGNTGLMKSVDKFDVDKGYKFSTYATWWIRQSITRSISDLGKTIRIPVHQVEKMQKYTTAKRKMQERLGYEPSYEELAIELNKEYDYVLQMEKIITNASLVSLESPIGEEEDSLLVDFIQDENVAMPENETVKNLLRKELERQLGTLTEREQTILRLRFGFDNNKPQTLEEVGKFYGVTRERIRQIEAKALRKLRHPSRSKCLKEYIEN